MICKNCGKEMGDTETCPTCGLDSRDYISDWVRETTNLTGLL